MQTNNSFQFGNLSSQELASAARALGAAGTAGYHIDTKSIDAFGQKIGVNFYFLTSRSMDRGVLVMVCDVVDMDLFTKFVLGACEYMSHFLGELSEEVPKEGTVREMQIVMQLLHATLAETHRACTTHKLIPSLVEEQVMQEVFSSHVKVLTDNQIHQAVNDLCIKFNTARRAKNGEVLISLENADLPSVQAMALALEEHVVVVHERIHELVSNLSQDALLDIVLHMYTFNIFEWYLGTQENLYQSTREENMRHFLDSIVGLAEGKEDAIRVAYKYDQRDLDSVFASLRNALKNWIMTSEFKDYLGNYVNNLKKWRASFR